MEYRKPRSPGRYRRNKGKRGELMLRDVLRAAGWPETERGQQRAGGGDAPDVRYGPERVHFECKNVETFNARKALTQAIGDAAPGSMPIVAQKCTRGQWIAVLKLDDLLELLKFRDLFEGRVPVPAETVATCATQRTDDLIAEVQRRRMQALLE